MKQAVFNFGGRVILTVGVVVCVYTVDRFADIVRAVDSLQAQSPLPDEIIVVVDHNDDLLSMTKERWPELKVIPSLGVKGLSGARNTGIAACNTDIIAFLDDDAAARAGWLKYLVRAYGDQAVAVTGGRANPVWPASAEPVMLPAELRWVVGCTYEGQPTETADVRNVMGCSMSFRRSELDGLGGFVEGIGRVGTLPLGCEETELCIRIRQNNPDARIVFEPKSIVDHRVGPSRTTWSYLIRRSYSEGISKAAISRLVGQDDALSTERAYTRSVLPKAVLREIRRGRPLAAVAIVGSLSAAAIGYAKGLRAKAVLPTSEPARI